ncbi:hypothetical protein [Pleionea sediminis]|uniref:hypothetical protein n=1 Tax=Pleionea sediminis TaxID=2569479 RepID=UPI0011872A9B|nr:hypothetical protein [Pleionea sediminis]
MKDITNWEMLSKFPKLKIINSMYIWLIIVPLMAKFFAEVGVNQDHKLILKMFEATVILDLKLPFSWVAFYLSSVCFVIANILVLALCPKIFKENDNFGEFKSKGRELGNLVSYVSDSTDPEEKKTSQRKEIIKEVRAYMDEGSSSTEIESMVYLDLCSQLKSQSAGLRTTVFVFYAFGFILLAWVFLENFKYVVTNM